MPKKRRKASDASYPYIYKRYGDKVVKSRVPVFTLPSTEKQRGVQNRLQAASRYAVAVGADPEATAFYTAAIKRMKMQKRWTVRNAAMKDFFNPPEFSSIELHARRSEAGAKLSCFAHDAFAVVRVGVLLRAGERILQEECFAEHPDHLWRFTFPLPLPDGTEWEVVIRATDRPGNCTTAVLPASAVQWI